MPDPARRDVCLPGHLHAGPAEVGHVDVPFAQRPVDDRVGDGEPEAGASRSESEARWKRSKDGVALVEGGSPAPTSTRRLTRPLVIRADTSTRPPSRRRTCRRCR